MQPPQPAPETLPEYDIYLQQRVKNSPLKSSLKGETSSSPCESPHTLNDGVEE